MVGVGALLPPALLQRCLEQIEYHDLDIVKDIIRTELEAFISALGVHWTTSGVVHCTCKDKLDGEEPADKAVRELQEALGTESLLDDAGIGTKDSPF